MTDKQGDATENPANTISGASSISTSYPLEQSRDDLPYIDASSPFTHPDCLYSMATLFGIRAAPVTKCRLLSLAAFDGTNLIATAFSLPGSQFVGLTNSKHDFEEANAKITALGLKNIEIKFLDIMDVNSDIGAFDYIVAQGLYSWVDDEKRKRILQLCRNLLNADGVVYVNYNSYPGWRMHNALRDMMLYHVRNEINNKEIVAKARNFTQIIAKAAPQIDHLYGLIMQDQLDMIKGWSDDYLLHDTLGDINQPFYFHEFADAARKEKLQFISDAEFHSMVPNKFIDDAVQLIKEQGNDRIAKEQYMDFFRNRMFKQTLLCHDNVQLNTHLNFQAFKKFYYTAPISPMSTIPDIQTEMPKTFKTIDNVAITSTDPIMKALLLYLSSQYPMTKNYDDILTNLQKILGSNYQYIAKDGKLIPFDEAVIKTLLDCYSIGVLKVFAHSIDVIREIHNKPKISELARYEAAHGLIITNQLHDAVRIDMFTHHVLPHLNGNNDVDSLVEILMEMVTSGKISFRKGDVSISDVDEIRDILKKRLINLISDFAKLGIFIA